MRPLLAGTVTSGPATAALAVAALAVAALVASAIPIRRALRANPAVVLRGE
jgi:ABC-type antimicrobial peptide transport system permease subunit